MAHITSFTIPLFSRGARKSVILSVAKVIRLNKSSLCTLCVLEVNYPFSTMLNSLRIMAVAPQTLCGPIW